MSRTINVSTDVFAAIWAKRRDGESTEDSVLRRVLGCGKAIDDQTTSPSIANGAGVYDSRNGVAFAEGFEIFRTYKRREYRAEARSGFWVRKDTGAKYPTLNQLNASITTGAENVWNGNWKFRADDGGTRSIGTLRR